MFTVPQSNKLNEILQKSQSDVLKTFDEAIAEINEESRAEVKKEFVSTFISDCNLLNQKIDTMMDFIKANKDDSKFKERCESSFKVILSMLSFYDECIGSSDLKHDTFFLTANKYNLRHNDALIVYAACSMNIESLRSFASQHMHLMKFQAPASGITV